MKSELEKTLEKTVESWSGFLDINVPLSVELGRVRLRVREILELKSDSIIKLSRSTGEGVDIRASREPLLRGEIVVIEDHAGVRINEIIVQENR